MATHAATRTLSGLARAMVQHGLLSEYDADTLQGQAQAANIGFVEQMLLSKRMTAMQVAMFASRAFGTPMMDLNGFDIDHIDKDLIDAKLVASRRALPLHKRGNRLFVAVSDPANLDQSRRRRGRRRGRQARPDDRQGLRNDGPETVEPGQRRRSRNRRRARRQADGG